MSAALIIAAVAGIAAAAAAVYFAVRDKNSDLPLPRGKTEPMFKKPPAGGGSPGSAVGGGRPSTAAGAAPAAEKKPSTAGQGSLSMENFTPPELPPPAENVLAQEMCYVVHFYGEEKMAAGYFAPLLEKLAQREMKGFRLLAFSPSLQQWKRAIDEKHEIWLLAIPLADRGGAMTEDKIGAVEEEVRKFAEGKPIHAVFSSSAEALQNAKLLDEFCNTVDQVIELRLSGRAHAFSRMDEVLRMNKLVKENGGRYVCRADSEILFAVKLISVDGGGVNTVVFEMDAPNVSDPPRAWENMRRCLMRVATVLTLNISDPKGEPVDDARMEEMRRQLTLLSKQMREFGVAPGGEIAHLLFS